MSRMKMNNSMRIEEMIERWKARRDVEGRAPISNNHPIYQFRRMAESLDCQYLTQEVVDTWFRRQDTEKVSSWYKRCSSLSSFFRSVVEYGWARVRVPELPRIRHCQAITYLPTEKELENLFRASCELPREGHSVFVALHNMALPVMLRLMESNGLRSGEVLSLRCCDVDLESGIIKVMDSRGKSSS